MGSTPTPGKFKELDMTLNDRQYQIVVLTSRGHIIEYKNYPETKTSIEAMFHYMTNMMMHPQFNKFEITRWNSKGEKE